ncbi:MAG: Bifunctional homocysteine S-methyltransferase/5,10-methylenetetrahydrofolate reductase [Planctomycetes bacterium ADurb.Bin401]|nr:MAG: Bifunctional homocysteine S-methyltransferase/5,10-methylenetetrahydrofolate reductase [Planctomycetes bacterium ADurb.Bin401]
MQTPAKKRLSKALKNRDGFAIVAELVGGPNFSFAPIQKFLTAFNAGGGKDIPAGFNFVGITNPQSPGGVANIEPSDVHRFLVSKNLLGDLDFIPHISCKDLNADALTSLLAAHRAAGVESVLALTGDKPAVSKGVFELESIGLLDKISRINNDAYLSAKPENLAAAKLFYAGAAVSPFKYNEESQMQQYFKMEKKVARGAKFLITQVGWDWKKSVELMRYLKENNINVPVLGNVYLLSTITPAPRLMHDIKLPGCFVSDELLAKVYSESLNEHIERAAQQIAMYKSIGAAGADVGGVHDYEMFIKILKRAAEIGSDWEKYKDNLCWPARRPFYLYDDAGNKTRLSDYPKTNAHRFFNFMHWSILDPEHKGFHAFKKVMKFFGVDKNKGFFYKSFFMLEKPMKYCLFDCEECGDCYLPENFGLCTIGGCEKGMDNAPCGDSTADGKCGNNLDRICIGDRIYKAAGSEKGGIEKLRKTINKPRIPALEHSASIPNYLFGRDHTMKNAIFNIGEAIHASIPKTGMVMKQLLELGDDCFSKDSPELQYILALIESQAADGADYIAVNIDQFGETDPALAVKLMKEYVKLVRKFGRGVPVCVDSSDDNVLIAGLKEWYDTSEKVQPPLVNSIKVYTMDNMMPLKKHYDFKFIGLLISEAKAATDTVDDLYNLAKTLYDAAMKHGFKAEEIFFDSTVFPLAIDMPMQPGVPGYTYRTFNTIKRIKTDPLLKNCHFSLGVTNSVRDLPARKIGVTRAYVEVAMRYGLDAGIVNAAHHLGNSPADPDLVKLVEAYADLDGSSEKLNVAMQLMGDFCSKNRKPSA